MKKRNYWRRGNSKIWHLENDNKGHVLCGADLSPTAAEFSERVYAVEPYDIHNGHARLCTLCVLKDEKRKEKRA
jgi:hypothetical protein